MSTNIDFYLNIIKEDVYTRNYIKIGIIKVGMNIGYQPATENKKDLLMPIAGLDLVSGRLPNTTYSKIAIADFNLKKNIPIGCTDKISGKEILYFLEKLKILTLPALKELHNFIKKNLDHYGNYGLGIKNLIFLPDINRQYERLQLLIGMDLIFNSSNYSDKSIKFMLNCFQIPTDK
jgi:large subunit ribosomal protein L5